MKISIREAKNAFIAQQREHIRESQRMIRLSSAMRK